MKWTPEEEANWIINHLSPCLKRNNFEHIKIFTIDENRLALPDWTDRMFQHKKVRDTVAGVALHYYFDEIIGPDNLDEIKRLFPEKSIIYTEACTGFNTGYQRLLLYLF